MLPATLFFVGSTCSFAFKVFVCVCWSLYIDHILYCIAAVSVYEFAHTCTSHMQIHEAKYTFNLVLHECIPLHALLHRVGNIRGQLVVLT